MSWLIPGLAGAVVSALVAQVSLKRAPERLLRVNVSGRTVPAVLGWGVVAGGLAGLGAATALRPADAGPGVLAATGIAIALLGGAGAWDDLRGDEQARGFRGHLRSLARYRMTGGLAKIAAGLVAGGVAALLLEEGTGDRAMMALIVALTANLVNLFDRAPGRAAKLSFLLFVIPAIAAPLGWTAAALGLMAALAAVLAADLREEGMLGDAGANPLGAVLGIGLALTISGAGRGALLGLLLITNLASERWSFSRAIERSRALSAVDRLGRRRAR